MKLAARFLAALAVLAFATPALPCGERTTKQVTASAEKPTTSGAVAKSEKKAKSSATKPAQATKPAAATN
ncbi:MAG TPA: hypothetical protein VIV57_16645 [Anaeromyxobacter sp.]